MEEEYFRDKRQLEKVGFKLANETSKEEGRIEKAVEIARNLKAMDMDTPPL